MKDENEKLKDEMIEKKDIDMEGESLPLGSRSPLGEETRETSF